MSAARPRHHARRSARPTSSHRWSRLPLESLGKLSAVEYRIFRSDLDGVLHRENVLVPPETERAVVAQALVRARRRLKVSVQHANEDIRAQPTLPFPQLTRTDPNAQDAPESLMRGTFRRFAAWWTGEDTQEIAR